MSILSKIDISINQKPFEKFHKVLISHNLYGIDTFEIRCRYESIEELDGFLIEKSKDFLGLPVVIQTKITEKDKEKDGINFRGYITEIQSSRSGMTDYDEVTISGGSSEIALDRKPTNRAFLDKTLGDIVKEVLKKYEFKSKVSPQNKERFPYIVQFEESDFAFIKRLSMRYGEWCFFNGKEFIFGEIPVTEKPLTIGYDLKNFRYGLRVYPVKFNLFAIHPFKADLYKYKSGSSKVESNLNMYGKHALKMSKKMYTEEGTDYYEHVNLKESDYKKGLDQVGETEESADAVRLTELSGTSTNGTLTAGTQVKINCIKQDGKGKMDFGKYLVTSVEHEMDNSLAYENTFSGIPAETKIPENTDPYLVRTSSNQIGMVADNRDPEKLGRIKITFWWMGSSKIMTPWVKVLTPYASPDAGFYFVPKKGSWIVVGFEDGDVEKPICLGNFPMEASNPDAAWTGNTNEYDAKVHAIRTAAGNTIEFHDSDGEEKLIIYDKDKKNKITMDSANGALTIQSDGTLNLKASNINIEADKEIYIGADKKVDIEAVEDLQTRSPNGKIKIASGQDMKIESLTNIEIDASTSLTAKAGVSAEVSASGNTVIKGAIVQIN